MTGVQTCALPIFSDGFLETLPDPAWVKDAGHRYVVVNRAFREMCLFQTGGDDIDVIDVTDFNLFPLELAEQSLQEDGKVATTRKARHGKLFLFSPSGESRHYATHRIALLDNNGGVAGTLGVAVDMTQQVVRDIRIRDNERRLDTLIDHLPLVVYQRRMAEDWSMQFVSEGSLGLTGYPAADFTEGAVRSWASIISPDDVSMAYQDVQNQLARGDSYNVEYRVISPDGTPRWVTERGVALPGAGGEPSSTRVRHQIENLPYF